MCICKSVLNGNSTLNLTYLVYPFLNLFIGLHVYIKLINTWHSCNILHFYIYWMTGKLKQRECTLSVIYFSSIWRAVQFQGRVLSPRPSVFQEKVWGHTLSGFWTNIKSERSNTWLWSTWSDPWFCCSLKLLEIVIPQQLVKLHRLSGDCWILKRSERVISICMKYLIKLLWISSFPF